MEPLYQSIFETKGTATAIIEADTTISLVNTEFVQLSGFSKEEVEGKVSWTVFIHPDDLEMMLERHKKRRQTEEDIPTRYEFRFIDRSDSIRNILVTIKMIPGTDKSVASLLDITENKKTQKELERRLLFERIISNISRKFINLPNDEIDQGINAALSTIGNFAGADRSYIFLIREETQTMDNTHEWCGPDVSPQRENLQDIPLEIMPWWIKRLRSKKEINIPSLDSLPPEAAVEKQSLSSQNIKSLAVVPLFYKEVLKGFLGFDSTKEAKQWLDNDFLLLHTIGDIIINTLERKTFEKQIERSERRYRDFLNFLPQAVFESDNEGNLTFVNQQAYTLFGYTHEEFLQDVTLFRMIDSREWDEAKKNIARTLQGEATKGREYTGVTKDGKNFPILVYSSPVFSNQQIVGMRGILIDMTERKELEDQLKQSQKMEAIGSLAGGIAHDFNNILTSIVGHCHLLLINESLTGECEKEVDNILASAKSGAWLTRQLLAFSRNQIVTPKIIDINEIITHSIKMLERLLKNNVSIQTDLGPELPFIKIDPGQMEQIIMNCVINSADAMPSGGTITIRTTRFLLDSDNDIQNGKIFQGEYIRLEIEDTGFGIEKDTIEKVFDPFFTTKEQGRGTGLGLSTVYGIVKQNLGYIDLRSTVQVGTSISVFLPTAS